MPNPSKDKGDRFESQVAASLSQWSGQTFRRTPSSGALRWRGAASTFGDVMPPEEFNCILECKSRKRIDYGSFLSPDFVEVKRKSSGDKKATKTVKPRAQRTKQKKHESILGWWKYQLITDCERYQRETARTATPILLFKQDRGLVKICMEMRVFVKVLHPKMNYITVTNTNIGSTLVITNLCEFINYVRYDDFRAACAD